MRKLSFQYVRHDDIPETLLEFLTRRFRYHDAAAWEALVQDGHVTVNGHRVSPGHILETRHRIVYVPPPRPEPEVDRRYTVLYEDDWLLAVSKSGNIPSSPSGKYWYNCLVHVLQTERGLPRLHAVHRLDRETSGVNLFAKTRTAARRLGRDFHEGRVGKGYAGILRGHLSAREAYVAAPLRDAVDSRVHIRQEVHPAGRESRTRFRLRALLPGASLVDIVPETGRTHQIRVHAAHLGHPVWGDKLYGVSESDFLAWIEQGDRSAGQRHLLHAAELSFTHPETGERVVVRDPPAVLVRSYYERADGAAVVGGDVYQAWGGR